VSVLPYLSSLATTVVAIVAIVVGRRSSKDVLSNELRQRMWEKRTDTYIEILKRTQEVHPDKVTLNSVMEQASDGEDVVILPYIETDEWLEFSARVDALSSDEVRSLFSLWERCLDGWTWCLSKLIAHRDEDDEFHLKSKAELETANEAILTARYLLTEHIRSELRFENRPLPNVRYVAPDGFFGAITEIEGEAGRLVRQSPRISSYQRQRNSDRFTVQLPR
jgi:hypothetical protein